MENKHLVKLFPFYKIKDKALVLALSHSVEQGLKVEKRRWWLRWTRGISSETPFTTCGLWADTEQGKQSPTSHFGAPLSILSHVQVPENLLTSIFKTHPHPTPFDNLPTNILLQASRISPMSCYSGLSGLPETPC